MQGVMGCDVLWFVLLMSVGSYAWSNGWMATGPGGDEVRSLQSLLIPGSGNPLARPQGPALHRTDERSEEDESILVPPSDPVAEYYAALLQQKRASGSPYGFGLGKRSRTYKFGLGKRLEEAWKVTPALPSYRQERRSNMYSFGLGKRADPLDPFLEDLFDGGRRMEVEAGTRQNKKSRQFSFGLGKRSRRSGS